MNDSSLFLRRIDNYWLWSLWCLILCQSPLWVRSWSLWFLLCHTASHCLLKSGIVANHHHAKQGSGNLSHPAETTEDKEGRRNEAEHTHTRDIAAEEVAEEVAEHVAAVAIGHAAKEIADAIQVVVGTIDSLADTVHGIAGCLAKVADGIADTFHLLANAVDGVRTDDGITDDSGDATLSMVSEPTTASPTILATLLSVVSFSHAT